MTRRWVTVCGLAWCVGASACQRAPTHMVGARPMPPAIEDTARSIVRVRVYQLPHGASATVNRTGRITSVQNAGDLTAGDACTVYVAPLAQAQFNCAVRIGCRGREIYAGRTQCGERDGAFVRASDPFGVAIDSNASLECDLLAGTVLLDDGAHRDNLLVRMRLDPG